MRDTHQNATAATLLKTAHRPTCRNRLSRCDIAVTHTARTPLVTPHTRRDPSTRTRTRYLPTAVSSPTAVVTWLWLGKNRSLAHVMRELGASERRSNATKSAPPWAT